MKYACLEGLDFSGKSSVAKALADRYGAVVISNPGSTTLAGELRELLLHKTHIDIPVEEACLLFTAGTVSTMRRARELATEGRRVVLDRGWQSTAAYQGASGADMTTLAAMLAAIPPSVMPDRVFYLMVSTAERERRARAAGDRGVDRFERKPSEYFARVSQGYADVANTMTPIDASYPVNDVADTIAEILGWKNHA